MGLKDLYQRLAEQENTGETSAVVSKLIYEDQIKLIREQLAEIFREQMSAARED